ncbi:MAG: ABC transporter ATP-binding protein [Alphaproteobacteria bacterium]|nr:ABC transporter ATP-binding protein [Alphaproteobacteria bacterium]
MVITAENLTKNYLLYNQPLDRLKQSLFRGRRNFYREVKALNPVSFTLRRGETVGIIGRNGSGKSTLLQLICGTVSPSGGSVNVNGRVSALLELGAGFNPEFSGRDNVFLNGAILGLSPHEVRAKLPEIEAFAGIGAFLDRPVKTYSSGMFLRLAFAVAVSVEPDILIVDEALAVGDEAFQRKCFARLQAMKERGCTILFVSHSAQTVVELCDRALLLDGGDLLLDGAPKTVVAAYHKLIFADPARQEAIRAGIRQGSFMPQAAKAAVKEEAFLDTALTPESQVVYDQRGALLENPRITTLAGETVNMLTRGERYVFTYDVTLSEPAYGLRCGMMFKTKSGIELGGSGTAGPEDVIAEAPAGSHFRVSFEFACLLLPGTYYANCGASGMVHGERTYLHRIVDACVFKVMPEPNMREGGIVDFRIDPFMEKLS